MKYLIALLLLTTTAHAQYGMPPWPGPRAPMPMGPPQNWRNSPQNRPWYNQYEYDDGASRWLYYPGPRDYYGTDRQFERRPFPPPPRGGYDLRYPY